MARAEIGTPRVVRALVVAVVALVAVCLCRILQYRWLGDVPHVMDEVVYDYQARTFALLRVKNPAVTPIAAFNYWFVEDRGARFGTFPPGWPAVLALGHLVDAAAWVNPLLHGATVPVVARLAARAYGPSSSVVAAVLYAFCPQAVLLAASRMSHTLVALLVALTLLALFEHLRAPRRRAAVLGGLALGATLVTRPFDGALLTVLVVVTLGPRLRRLGGAVVAAWVAPVAVLLALFAWHTWALTGSPLRLPSTAYFEQHLPPIAGEHFRYGPGCNALGLGPTHGCEKLPGDHGHDLAHAGFVVRRNVVAWLRLAGGFGALVLAAALTLALGRSRRRTALLLALLPLAVLGYALYWNPGTCFGARFYHVALPGFVVAASGVVALRRVRGRLSTAAALVGLLLWSGLALRRAGAEVGHRYWGVDRRFAAFVEQWRGPPALVLVAFRTRTWAVPPDSLAWTGYEVLGGFPNGTRIGGAFAQNTPGLDGPVVFAKFHDSLVPDLRAAFPGRVVLFYAMGDEPADDLVFPLERVRLRGVRETPEPNFDSVVLE